MYAAGSDAGPPMFRAADDAWTAGAVLLTLDDGTLATATATRLNGAGYDVRMELAGELDQIVVGLDDRAPIASTEPTGPRRRQAVDGFRGALRARLRGRAEHVRAGGARRAGHPRDGREALQALGIAEACDVSRRERRPVRLAEASRRSLLGVSSS